MRGRGFFYRKGPSLAYLHHVFLPVISRLRRRERGEDEVGRRDWMKKRKVRKILEEAQEKHPTDVLGSWTGVPWDPEEEPVQDADDL